MVSDQNNVPLENSNFSDEVLERANDTQALNEKILSFVPVGIAAYRSDGQCVLVNDEAERIMRTSRAELLKINFRQSETWKSTGLLKAAEAVLSGQPSLMIEIHATSVYGHEIWLSCRFSTFQLAGEPRLLLVFDDIFQQRKAEKGSTLKCDNPPPTHAFVLVLAFTQQHKPGNAEQNNHQVTTPAQTTPQCQGQQGKQAFATQIE